MSIFSLVSLDSTNSSLLSTPNERSGLTKVLIDKSNMFDKERMDRRQPLVTLYRVGRNIQPRIYKPENSKNVTTKIKHHYERRQPLTLALAFEKMMNLCARAN